MLGILCGLDSEARIARRSAHTEIACAGARPQKARWLARELIKKGATRLLSFGVAGALEPGLPIGSLIIGTQVKSVDGRWGADNAWVRELSQKLPEAHCGSVWGSEILIPTAKDKRSIYEKSQCLIVDMESQCAAQIAAEANIPFTVLRAVCDHSDMDVPPIVMAAIREDGSIDYARAAWHFIRHPAAIMDLAYVGKGMNRALKALEPTVALL